VSHIPDAPPRVMGSEQAMEAFYFESGGDKLFGVYHPAHDVFSQKAVLICPPIYAEYFRTYRYFRKLADAWSKAGHHVLRFDYFGTGDSSGDWNDAGPDRWLQDIEAAATELRDISGCSRICLAGARVGASLALTFASKSDIADRVLIWDPVVDGTEYLRSLANTHTRLLDKADPRTRKRLSKLPAEFAGFRHEKWVDVELGGILLNSLDTTSISNIQYVASSQSYLDRELIKKLAASGVDVNEILCEDDCDWGTPSESAMQAVNVYAELKSCL